LCLALPFALLGVGFTWKAVPFAIVLFSLFLLYLHSGWFHIDLSQPLFPIRRDDRGAAIQRKALIAAIIVSLLAYLVLSQTSGSFGLPIANGSLALSVGVITYFISQFVFYLKA